MSIIRFLQKMGRRIAYLRKKQKMQQQTLAFAVNIDKSHMSDIEAGKCNPTSQTLVRIIRKLGVSPEKFFRGMKDVF